MGSFPPKIWRDRAVWSAREPHKLEVVGSNPTPAPKLNKYEYRNGSINGVRYIRWILYKSSYYI